MKGNNIMRNLSIILLFLTIGCTNTPYLSRTDYEYREYKSNFNRNLTKHFPKHITHQSSGMTYSTNETKNDISLTLIEKKLSAIELDSIKMFCKKNALAEYQKSHKCILFINKFETKETYENFKVVNIIDSTLVEKPCYKGKYPIPAFSSYQYGDSDLDDVNLKIYVLDAKSGLGITKFDLKPNRQMPIEWKNGYSRGIAINEDKRTVVYWLRIW